MTLTLTRMTMKKKLKISRIIKMRKAKLMVTTHRLSVGMTGYNSPKMKKISAMMTQVKVIKMVKMNKMDKMVKMIMSTKAKSTKKRILKLETKTRAKIILNKFKGKSRQKTTKLKMILKMKLTTIIIMKPPINRLRLKAMMKRSLKLMIKMTIQIKMAPGTKLKKKIKMKMCLRVKGKVRMKMKTKTTIHKL